MHGINAYVDGRVGQRNYQVAIVLILKELNESKESGKFLTVYNKLIRAPCFREILVGFQVIILGLLILDKVCRYKVIKFIGKLQIGAFVLLTVTRFFAICSDLLSIT